MLKHRLSKICSTTFVVLCMLFTGSFIFSSCQDMFDIYKYDDGEPDWLGSSIYDFLKDETSKGEHTYKNYIGIIDSLGYKDILSRTGSKTLFVADDASFETFYANNRWGVKSFSELTKSQMALILRSSMLDNAYLLDMMSSTEGNPPAEGTCLRRVTASVALDSVPYLQPERLPQHNSHWDRFRQKGVRVAIDGTRPMMVHFLNDYLVANNITDRDVQIIFNGQTRADNEAYIYQNKILASGIKYDDYSDDTLTVICKNGYVYRLDNVLLPPSNMAEELRNLPNTRLFSRMLDRFSVPVFDGSFDRSYDELNTGTNDSVFMFRYVNRSKARKLIGITKEYIVDTDNSKSEDQNFLKTLLLYDPGWNQYQDGDIAAERDMAAMFVPSDQYIYNFFKDSTGRILVDQFAPEVPITDDIYSIQPALDSIPNNIIVEFLNNLMQKSFIASVPSKFDKVQNDGYEPLGLKESDIDECIVANNGVIYILNNVFGPAKYRSVSAPPLILENMTIMNALINKLRYDSYLLAMDATYSFIVPDNDYFVYYDPVTIKHEGTDAHRAYTLHYNNKYPEASSNADAKLWARVSSFDTNTYEILNDSVKTDIEGDSSPDNNLNSFINNRAVDLLEYLIIVGNVEDGNKYYQSKGYGFIKCDVDAQSPEGITFYGGENLENGTSIKVQSGGRHVQDNGITYCTISGTEGYPSGIPTPPTHSVADKLSMKSHGQPEFEAFYNLASPVNVPSTTDESYKLGLVEIVDSLFDYMKSIGEVSAKDDVDDKIYQYSIFSADARNNITPLSENVPFFSKYHYTVYVPSNEAVQAAYDNGLVKWNDVVAEIAAGNYARATAMLKLLNKVARYHFQDNAVFVDNKPFSKVVAGKEYTRLNFETAAINSSTGRFYELEVETNTPENAQRSTLTITDQMGNVANVLNEPQDEGRTWNIMARDLAMVGTSPQGAKSIATSAYSVIHLIDQLLVAKEFIGYDGKFVRYTVDGLTVDSMSVSGAEAADCYIRGDENKYLVASYDEIIITTANNEREAHRVAYLLKPKADSAVAYEQEEYVLDANGEKILITDQGFRVKESDGVFVFCNEVGEVTESPTLFFSNDGSSKSIVNN